MFKKISKGEFDQEGLSEDAARMIGKMLSVDARQRPSAEEMLQDAWIKYRDFSEEIKVLKRMMELK